MTIVANLVRHELVPYVLEVTALRSGVSHQPLLQKALKVRFIPAQVVSVEEMLVSIPNSRLSFLCQFLWQKRLEAESGQQRVSRRLVNGVDQARKDGAPRLAGVVHNRVKSVEAQQDIFARPLNHARTFPQRRLHFRIRGKNIDDIALLLAQ